MASQYEQGPEAKAAEEGMALADLMQRTKSAQMLQAGLAGAQAGQTRANLETQHQNRLAEMLQGEQLKEDFAQREAERTAPFLRTMISGNPNVAKAFGFGQNVTQPGELPVPEAGYAGTQPTTTFQPRQPTVAEATGLSRAVPGITSTLLKSAMDPNAGFTLGKDQIRFDAKGNPIAQGPSGQEGGGAYATLDEAMAVKDQMERSRPDLRGRIAVDQNTKGQYQLKVGTSEPLTEGPNKWLADANNENLPVPQRIKAQEIYNKWKEDQMQIAGGKALSVAQNTPYNEEAKKRLETSNMAIQAAHELSKFTKQDIENFTGAGRLGYEAARIAQEAGLPIMGNYTPEDVQRYNQFKVANGYIEQMKFAIGGKQLTQGEQKVVEAFIPTGRELTTAEYQAKVANLIKVMEASQELDSWMSTAPKTETTPENIRLRFKASLRAHGINVDVPAKDATLQSMPSGARLRSKYGQP